MSDIIIGITLKLQSIRMEPANGWDQTLLNYKYPILLSLVGVVLLFGGLFSSGILATKTTTDAPTYSKQVLTQHDNLFYKVDISGQVKNPGVYSLEGNSRVEDAIKAAGGVTSQANQVFLTKTINLDQKISDGMKIYIPSQDEELSGVATTGGSSLQIPIKRL